MQTVLLLNASYEPLKVITWQKAVTMFFLGKVEVVEESDREVHSISLVIRVPAVVRLLKFAKIGRRSPPLSRINILARDNFTCQYCAKPQTVKEATLDHVKPRSQGGKTSWENIVCCCAHCNRKKGGRTPQEAKMLLLTTPRKPDWLPILTMRFNGGIPKAWQLFLSIKT